MNKMITLLLMLFSLSSIGQNTLKGTIISEENEDPVVGATVKLLGQNKTTLSDEDGIFFFNFIESGVYQLSISAEGYPEYISTVSLKSKNSNLTFRMSKDGGSAQVKAYSIDLVEVNAAIINNDFPVSYSSIDPDLIEKTNLGQDVPFLLESSPSVVVSSDAGAGIGYTGIRVRGSDPTRINVTINGIPLNDSESQGVFWVNLPDFASSTDNIQIQRGVGTSTNGAGSFGASLNLGTNKLETKPYGELSGSLGSFNSLRGAAKFGTGLIQDKFYFEGRISGIQSDGYIDRARSDLQSFYIGSGFINDRSSLKFNVFSGKERTYQAWNGVPQTYVDDEVLRKTNTAGTEKSGEPYQDEVDNYNQTHYQLFYNRNIKNDWLFSGAIHYTKGKGYFEQYKAGESLGDYGIEDVVLEDTTITTTDLIRRRWLDNDFYGTMLSLEWTPSAKEGAKVKLGGAFNQYLGGHFGEVIWARTSSNSEIYDRYYDNDATKNDFNIYTQVFYPFSSKLSGYLDLQLRSIDYTFLGLGNDGNPLDQDDQLSFFNPKAGITYEVNAKNTGYLSFAVGNKEPNRNDYTESSTLSRPLSERLYNAELGWRKTWNKAGLNANVYYMYYQNQLALNGQINDVGEFSRINIPESYRLGLELESKIQITDAFIFSGNATFSTNKITEFTEYVDNWDTWGQEEIIHTNTDLSFSPSLIAFGQLEYFIIQNDQQQLSASLNGKYVGRQYIDNTQTLSRSLDPYFLNDLILSYKLEKVLGLKEVSFNFMLKNIFDQQFSSNAWVYRFTSEAYDPRPDDPYVTANDQTNGYDMIGLYPQAGRYFLAGINVQF